MTGCLGCFTSAFKYYHFENFTFSHSHDTISKRSTSNASRSRPSRYPSKPKRPRSFPSVTIRSDTESEGMTSFVPPAVPLTSRVSDSDTGNAFNPLQSNRSMLPVHNPRRTVHAELEGPPPAYFDFRNNPDSDNPDATPNLPLPPTIAYRKSPAANASKSDAERALAFTNANPLSPPRPLTLIERHALSMGYTSLSKPPELGRNKLYCSSPSAWGLRGLTTKKGCKDACLISSTPLFSALHSPAHDYMMLAYFEVRIIALDPKREGIESGIAIGFVAQPYPTWRMPGHERASLGVHSDDGRRYINDSWGGRDFIAPFRTGDVMGIGMRFKPSVADDRARLPAYGHSHGSAPPSHDYDVTVFCVRNGVIEGLWDLHEQVDAEFDQPGGLVGLEGHHDLHAAIGVFGKVDLEVRFGRKDWLFNPPATF